MTDLVALIPAQPCPWGSTGGVKRPHIDTHKEYR